MYLCNGQCVSECLQGYYLNSINSLCESCNSNCLTCIKSPLNCLSCQDHYFFVPSINSCVSSENCPERTFGNVVTRICENCDRSCLICSGKSPADCVLCNYKEGYIKIDNSCQKLTCGDGNFVYIDLIAESVLCRKCNTKCLTCFGPSSTNCMSCAPGYMVRKLLNMRFLGYRQSYLRYLPGVESKIQNKCKRAMRR